MTRPGVLDTNTSKLFRGGDGGPVAAAPEPSVEEAKNKLIREHLIIAADALSKAMALLSAEPGKP